MNYALDDRHRSLRRFLMNALGSPPWTIRTERQPVKDEARPVAVIEPASAAVTTRARTSIPQGDVEKQQTFSLTLYPSMLGDSAADTRLTAATAAQQLDDAISKGLSNDDESVLSAPLMIPVYDFDGVAVKGAERAGPEENYGWLWVEDAPVRPIQDPEDVMRWTVTCDLRVSWSEGGRVRPPATPAVSMPGTGVFTADGELP